MNNFNFSVIEGRLTEDPVYEDGVCKFTLETTSNEKSTLFPVVTKGKLAEVCSKYLTRGSRVLVSGQLGKVDDELSISGKEVNFLKPSNQ